MSNLAFVMERLKQGDKIRFFQDYFGKQWIELSRGWLLERKVRVAVRLRHALRSRKRRPTSIASAPENVLIVGLNALTELFLRYVADHGRESIAVAGILSGGGRHLGRRLRSCRVLGRPEDLEKILNDLDVHGVGIDRIVLTSNFAQLSAEARSALKDAQSVHDIRIDSLWERFLPARSVDGRHRGVFAPASSPDANKNSFPAPNPSIPTSRRYLRWKRLIDFLAAAAGILCFAPVMVVVYVVALLDVGYPAIFWQLRPGAFGRPIKVLKFRTMSAARDANCRRRSDAERLSSVGRFLRRGRLDELPQLFNVLAGQMSFVGPRPLLPADQSPGLASRLHVRPGLTGWAQIKGGRHLSADDKAALDLWYIKNASFSLDAMILVSTARTVLIGERIDRRAIVDAWRDIGVETPNEAR